MAEASEFAQLTLDTHPACPIDAPKRKASEVEDLPGPSGRRVAMAQATQHRGTALFFDEMLQALSNVWSTTPSEHADSAVALEFYNHLLTTHQHPDNIKVVIEKGVPAIIVQKLKVAADGSTDWAARADALVDYTREWTTFKLIRLADLFNNDAEASKQMEKAGLNAVLVLLIGREVLNATPAPPDLPDGALALLEAVTEKGNIHGLWDIRSGEVQPVLRLPPLFRYSGKEKLARVGKIILNIYHHGDVQWKRPIINAMVGHFKEAAGSLQYREGDGGQRVYDRSVPQPVATIEYMAFALTFLSAKNDHGTDVDRVRVAKALIAEDALPLLMRVLRCETISTSHNNTAAVGLLATTIARSGDPARARAVSEGIMQLLPHNMVGMVQRYLPGMGWKPNTDDGTARTLLDSAEAGVRLLAVLTDAGTPAATTCRVQLAANSAGNSLSMLQCVIDFAIEETQGKRFQRNMRPTRKNAVLVLCHMLRGGNALGERWWDKAPSPEESGHQRLDWQTAIATALNAAGASDFWRGWGKPFYHACIQGMRDYAERGFGPAQALVSAGEGDLAQFVLGEAIFASLMSPSYEDPATQHWMDQEDGVLLYDLKRVVGERTFATAAHAFASILASGAEILDRLNAENSRLDRTNHPIVRNLLLSLRPSAAYGPDMGVPNDGLNRDPVQVLLNVAKDAGRNMQDRMAAIALGDAISRANPRRTKRALWESASKDLVLLTRKLLESLPALPPVEWASSEEESTGMDASLGGTDDDPPSPMDTGADDTPQLPPANRNQLSRVELWRVLMEHPRLFDAEYVDEQSQNRAVQEANAYLLLDLMRSGSSNQKFNALEVLHRSTEVDGFLIDSYLTRGGLKQVLELVDRDIAFGLEPSGSAHQTVRRVFLVSSLLRHVARFDDNRTPFPIFRGTRDDPATRSLLRMVLRVFQGASRDSPSLVDRLRAVEALVETLARLLHRGDATLTRALIQVRPSNRTNAPEALCRAIEVGYKLGFPITDEVPVHEIALKAAEALLSLMEQATASDSILEDSAKRWLQSTIFNYAGKVIDVYSYQTRSNVVGGVDALLRTAFKILLQYVQAFGPKKARGEGQLALLKDSDLGALVRVLEDVQEARAETPPEMRRKHGEAWIAEKRLVLQLWLALLKYGMDYTSDDNRNDVNDIVEAFKKQGWMRDCIADLKDASVSNKERWLAVHLLHAYVSTKGLSLAQDVDRGGGTDAFWELAKDEDAPLDLRSRAMKALFKMHAQAVGDTPSSPEDPKLAIKILSNGDLSTWMYYFKLREYVRDGKCTELQHELSTQMPMVRRIFAEHPEFYNTLKTVGYSSEPLNCWGQFGQQIRALVLGMLEDAGFQKAAALALTNPSFPAALNLAQGLDRSALDLVADLQRQLGTGNHKRPLRPIVFDIIRRVLKQNLGRYDALLDSDEALAQAVLAAHPEGDPATRNRDVEEGLEFLASLQGVRMSDDEKRAVAQLRKVLGMIKSGAKKMRGTIDLVNRLRAAHINPNDDEMDDGPVGGPVPDRVRFRKILRHVEETVNDPGSPFYLYHVNQMQSSANQLPQKMFQSV